MTILQGSSVSPVEHQKLVDARFQASAAYWQEIYQREDLFAAIHQQRRAVVLALADKIRLSPESHILEVGCGAGLTTVALAQRGCVVEAVDTVGAMLDLTRHLAVEAGVGQQVIRSVGDVHHLAFPDNVFSLVLAIGLTPWLHSLNKGMQEMARVLKPGGYLIVSADNRWRLNHVLDPRLNPALASVRRGLRNALQWLGRRQQTAQAALGHMYSIKEFDSLLSTAGLNKVEGMTLGFGPFSFLSYKLLPDSIGVKTHYKLQRLADHRFPVLRSTGAQYIVLARKFGPKWALFPRWV